MIRFAYVVCSWSGYYLECVLRETDVEARKCISARCVGELVGCCVHDACDVCADAVCSSLLCCVCVFLVPSVRDVFIFVFLVSLLRRCIVALICRLRCAECAGCQILVPSNLIE